MKEKLINLESRDLNFNESTLEIADKFFSAQCRFVVGTTDFNVFPPTDKPEIAFIGRSNVGKSSIINELVKQKALARVSVTPGRTQQVNFFCLNNQLNLVDLPGYGFAKAPKNLVKAWERMSLGYLKNRDNLKRLFLLIDSRHGFKVSDMEFIDQLNKFAINFQVVLTKTDKANKDEITKTISLAKEMVKASAAMFPDLILTSSKNDQGIKEIRNYIYNLMLS